MLWWAAVYTPLSHRVWWLEIQAVVLCADIRVQQRHWGNAGENFFPRSYWQWLAGGNTCFKKKKSPQVLPAFPLLYVDLLALWPWVEAWWLACCSTCASDASSSVVNVAGSCRRQSPQFLFSLCDCYPEQVWYVPRCRSCTGTAWGWELLSGVFDWCLCKRSMVAAHSVLDLGSGLGQCWGSAWSSLGHCLGGWPDAV